jgi:uncharacterized protein (DUF1786 family)
MPVLAAFLSQVCHNDHGTFQQRNTKTFRHHHLGQYPKMNPKMKSPSQCHKALPSALLCR